MAAKARFMKNTKTGAIFPYNEAHAKNLFVEGLRNPKMATMREVDNYLVECDANGKAITTDAPPAPAALVQDPQGSEAGADTEPEVLEDLDKDELITLARSIGIDIDARSKEVTIIDKIREVRAAAAASA